MKILITGSSGFIGSAITDALAKSNVEIVTPVRSKPRSDNCHQFYGQDMSIPDINRNTNWKSFLNGVDVIVHSAAMSQTRLMYNPQQVKTLRSVNVDGTLNLARQAKLAGVRRFVFLSSIKVNGESTTPGKPFRHNDVPSPSNAYSVSKLEAEIELQKICSKTNMEFVIIRPPIVYGSNVKGNFGNLVKFVKYGIPLPLSKIVNKRSMIGIDNLVDLITTCIKHPKAANQIFLASDGNDLSTSELLFTIGQTIGKPSKLFSCPPEILSKIAKFFGRKEITDRLLGSLQVDISKTESLLGWRPPFTVEESLKRSFTKL